MKLAEWIGSFTDDQLKFIADQLAGLGTPEELAIVGKDDEGRPRALVVTDVGLLDCHEAFVTNGQFEVALTPWPDAPLPWIVFVGFVGGGGEVDPSRGMARVSMALDPPFAQSYDKVKDVKAATDFYNAAIRQRGVTTTRG